MTRDKKEKQEVNSNGEPICSICGSSECRGAFGDRCQYLEGEEF